LDITFFQYNRDKRPEYITYLQIPSFSSYFQFKYDGKQIFGYPSATEKGKIKITLKISKKKDKRMTKLPPIEKEKGEKIFGEKRYHNRLHITGILLNIQSLCDLL